MYCIKAQEKKRKLLSWVPVSSVKREIRHFYVVVEQRGLRNVQKSVMDLQSFCFANKTCSFFCCSRCSSSLIIRKTAGILKAAYERVSVSFHSRAKYVLKEMNPSPLLGVEVEFEGPTRDSTAFVNWEQTTLHNVR